MLSSRKRLEERTGKYDAPRFEYLQQLVTEFQDSKSEDMKLQVLANLANFAYDPINYTHLKRLNVIELFLDCLDEDNEKMVEFAIGGISNCCAYPEFVRPIIDNEGMPLIEGCLRSSNTNTTLSALSSLFLLLDHGTAKEVRTPSILQTVEDLSNSGTPEVRITAQAVLQEFGSLDP